MQLPTVTALESYQTIGSLFTGSHGPIYSWDADGGGGKGEVQCIRSHFAFQSRRRHWPVDNCLMVGPKSTKSNVYYLGFLHLGLVQTKASRDTSVLHSSPTAGVGPSPCPLLRIWEHITCIDMMGNIAGHLYPRETQPAAVWSASAKQFYHFLTASSWRLQLLIIRYSFRPSLFWQQEARRVQVGQKLSGRYPYLSTRRNS